MRLSEMTDGFESKNDEQKKKTISQSYEELKDCSSDELMKKLADTIKMQKSSGTFNYEAIISSIEKMKPYLPMQAYENMIRIIDNFR